MLKVRITSPHNIGYPIVQLGSDVVLVSAKPAKLVVITNSPSVHNTLLE